MAIRLGCVLVGIMLWASACAGGSSGGVTDAHEERTGPPEADVAEVGDAPDPGFFDPDAGQDDLLEFFDDADVPLGTDPAAPDLVDTEIEARKERRLFTFRTVAGVSMGANAVTIAAHYPDRFDTVGSMGGYVDFRYLAHVVGHQILGGFCPMEQILANLDRVNDPAAEGVFCGPVAPTMPYEWEWSFNHFHYDNSGGHWGREFYLEVIEGFQMAFGNMLFWNPDNPLLPPGVSLDWWNHEADPCANPAVVSWPYNINKEYNPEGIYDLITFCDGDSVECSETTLDCLAAKGAYEPDAPHRVPVRVLLAVDYNGNRRRDYGEPVIQNAAERFEDIGSDGCADPYEDGHGGCLAQPRPDASSDPNRDNFDLFANPTGTERNFEYDDGEPFEDFGLDGVPAEVAGFSDQGEGDEVFSLNPRLQALYDADARTFFRTAPLDKIRRINWWFDGGIRDAIHALTSTMHHTNALKARGLEVREYDDFTATDRAILPGVSCDEYFNHLSEIDFSARGLGRNVLVRYGDPNASDAAILQGDGKHVGLICQMTNRLLTFFAMAAFRTPDPILYADDGYPGRVIHTSVWSPALKNRVRYSVSLPPGYDDPAHSEDRYPLMIFLPGHGMSASDMVQSGVLFNFMMQQGLLPRFILLAPEGQCCYVKRATGERYCGCEMGGTDCLDLTCEGPHESCAIVPVSKKDLRQECNAGHFFVNHRTNRWGDPDAASVMRFEDALFDMIANVDARFRTRFAAELEVPQDF